MSNIFRKALIDKRTNLYFWTHDFLALVTIASTVSIVLETVPALTSFERVFVIVEWTAVIIFTVEYGLRLFLTKPWHHYTFSFFGLIDLVSIVPTYLGLGNLVFLKSARIVRLIRLLRLIRLAKIRHLHTHAHDIEYSGGVVAINITLYLVLLLGTMIGFGTALYVIEGATGVFTSIPSAMWWTFEVFVNARPYEIPATALGGVFYVLARFTGLILLGALVGVVGNIMHHYLLKKNKR